MKNLFRRKSPVLFLLLFTFLLLASCRFPLSQSNDAKKSNESGGQTDSSGSVGKPVLIEFTADW